jgi:glycosyltransferase involved in cell wall biosynthesis
MDPKQGGVVQALKTMAQGLSLKSIHNEVLSLDNSESPFLLNLKLTVHAIGQGKGPWRFNNRLPSWLITNLSYFDTVILHGLWLYPNYATTVAIKKLKAQNIATPKLFVMPHGMLDPYFQNAPGRKLKAFRNRIYWRLIESGVIKQAEGVLYTCEEERLLAATTFDSYTPQREYVVGLGVENPPHYAEKMTAAFLNNCPGLENSPYLLFISRIDPKKGIELLIKAYSETLLTLSQDINNIPVSGIMPKLVIAGPGLNTVYGQKMQKLVVKDKALQKSILFPGMLEGDAKWGAFYGCEAFILPSHQENFGIAVVEALACSKSVLISSKINIWREIDESGAGFIAEDTQEGVSKTYDFWLQASYKQKKAISRNALYCYKKYFSVAPTTTNLLKALTGPHL